MLKLSIFKGINNLSVDKVLESKNRCLECNIYIKSKNYIWCNTNKISNLLSIKCKTFSIYDHYVEQVGKKEKKGETNKTFVKQSNP